MKKAALIIIALAFALTGCASVGGKKETSSIPTETIVSIDTAPTQTTEKDSGTADNPISQTEAEETALAECKVNYDYIKATFDATQNTWEIGFWEDNAVIASQTIVVNNAGNILNSWFAE